MKAPAPSFPTGKAYGEPLLYGVYASIRNSLRNLLTRKVHMDQKRIKLLRPKEFAGVLIKLRRTSQKSIFI